MNHRNIVTRLIAAASAAAVTVWLVGSVVSLAEPQRSVLIAKVQQRQAGPAPIRLAVATSRAASNTH